MNVGITGHQKLDDESAWQWVESSLSDVLASMERPLVGVTSLAAGADQLFARLILEHEGTLHVVVPFIGYESTFNNKRTRDAYRDLLIRAGTTEILPNQPTEEESYFTAGKRVIELADVVVAVWDGEPAAGFGGTGDAVEYAHHARKGLIHLNPVTREVIASDRNPGDRSTST